MQGRLLVKRAHKVVPLTAGELDNLLKHTVILQIHVLEQKFSRARSRMVKLGYRNQITELYTKLNNIHEGY